MINKQKSLMLAGILSLLIILVFASVAEEPNGNGVIVAGNTWASYRPPHIPGAWPGRNAYINDLATRGDQIANGNWIFWQSRYITSGLFGNTVFSWPFGRNIADSWGAPLQGIVFDPDQDFADANGKIFAAPPVELKDLNYSYLKYNTNLPGAGDPARDYVRPGGKTGGGANLSADKGLATCEFGYPTNVGIDVKVKVYSLTTTWGSLDDNQLVEVEFYNTGICDMDGDGTVDLTNHDIDALAFQYHSEPWFMSMNKPGTRTYNIGGYRAAFHDATPDENGAPWAYSGYGMGANNKEFENDPGIMTRDGVNKGYYSDIVYGFTFVGALSVDDNLNVTGEKNLLWKDTGGNEVVHATGEGVRRGWFQSNHSTESQIGGGYGTARSSFINSVAQFYIDAGKNRTFSIFDHNPNPAMFASGDPEFVTSWVIKDDPSTWTYPDGNFEITTPVTSYAGITLPGANPIPDFGGAANRPFHPDQIHAGVVTENSFGREAQCGFGPFSLKVGERIRIYFVRAMGHRPARTRDAIKAGRAMYEGIKANNGELVDPGAPAVPEIKITGSSNVKPLIMFDEVAGADGYKIYRSKAWPSFNSTVDGYMYEAVYWKTMTEGRENRPSPDPLNPMLTNTENATSKPGEHWGPYALLKHITTAQLPDYLNPRGADASAYPYAYEDSEDAFTLPGQTFYYYVAAYKNTPPSAPYAALDDVGWIESGKVNVNGRDGLWHNTWPFTSSHSWFPDDTEVDALQKLGAAFVLVSPPASAADLELDRTKIAVRPNPYKRVAFHDVGAEHKILFANLPPKATITIMDLSGQLIERVDYIAPTDQNGTYFWDMYSKDGILVANGVYIWIVEHERGLEKGVLSILR